MSLPHALVLVTSLVLCATPSVPPAELRLTEIFGSVGARGLELSAKARGLEGGRVRMTGYMVHREEDRPGSFLLAPFPVQLHDREYGLADDLPAATIVVEGPVLTGRAISHTSRLLALTGTLRLGPREEADGRISFVRLVLDAPPSAVPSF